MFSHTLVTAKVYQSVSCLSLSIYLALDPVRHKLDLVTPSNLAVDDAEVHDHALHKIQPERVKETRDERTMHECQLKHAQNTKMLSLLLLLLLAVIAACCYSSCLNLTAPFHRPLVTSIVYLCVPA